MVFMPPGSAKSTYGNVLFSAWYVGKNPGKKLITASYGQEVADKWGRKVRGIVRDEEYQATFAATLSQESQAAGRWELTTKSEYYAVGVGGSVTSFRADGGIIDDPVKGREEADSETIRKKTIEWYKSDFWTRLKPGAWVIVIMTRWHEEDLAGFLLEDAKHGGEKWDVLSLPALAEENDPLGRAINEPLWPEWFTPEMFTIAKRDARNWSALYQQRPAPEDGDFFKREWLKFYDELPTNLKYYGASDYAVTASGGDYTVHGVVGVDKNDDIYIVDWWREQTASDVWIDVFLSLVKQYKPGIWGEENGQILKSLDPFIKKRMQETKTYCFREQFPSAADKPTRAQGIRARVAMGKVYLPSNAPWLTDLINEMMVFPSGKNDDQVDVLGLIGRLLDKLWANPKLPGEPEKPRFLNDMTADEVFWPKTNKKTDYERI